MKTPKILSPRVCAFFIFLAFLITAGLWVTIAAYGAEETATPTCSVYYDGSVVSESGCILNGTPYIPSSLALDYGNFSKVSLDTANARITIDLSKQTLLMADDTVTGFVKKYGGIVYIPLREINGEQYVPLNSAEQFLKLSATVKDDTIYLYAYSGSDKIARVNADDVQAVSSLSGSRGLSSFGVERGETVFIKAETDNYYKIQTSDGNTGYLMKSVLTTTDINLAAYDFYAPRQQKYVRGTEKINLVWQYVDQVTPAAPDDKKDGIDILAPTWFDQIVEGSGAVENNGDLGYTLSAQENGYLVWATITNNASTKGSTAYTTKVFADTALLNKTVAQYLFYACLYQVDGINIDYEDVLDSDASGLTAFTALLRTYTEKQGLNLSIDTLVPKTWTIEYDRDALAKYVDFLAVMTYDEHYSGSPSAGSVASLPWVIDAVEATLEEVPAEKVLLGIPLYTRVWVVDSTGAVIRNPSASMTYIQNLIVEKGLTPTWLTKEKQNFISYPNDIYTEKIWIEDARSIANRLALVKEYNIAGSACWQYSQGSEDIWDVFDGMLNQGKTISEYTDLY